MTFASQASPARDFDILDFIGMTNIAEVLKDDVLAEIAVRVWDEYEIDNKSRTEKIKEWDQAAQAFKMERKSKDYPFTNAANVKFPLLLTSAIQFASRAMGAVLHDGRIAKAKVVGEDPQGMKSMRADRIATWQNYQMLDRDRQWVEETDRMLLQMPVFGDGFKKLYRDPAKPGWVSELVSCYDYIVNAGCRSGEVAPRATHRYDLYPYQISERKRDGRFLDIDLPYQRKNIEEEGRPQSGPFKEENYQEDPSAPHEFLEQYRREDLDEDGYPEPYIVTLHAPSRKIVRMVAQFDQQDIKRKQSGYDPYTGQPLNNGDVIRIDRRPEPIFIQYGFLPDPDGGYYNIGYGRLLADPVDTINTTINQILDAGNLQNASGGFMGKEFRLTAGVYKQEPGVFKQVPFSGDDIRKSIVRMEHPGPSPVLMQMLTFLNDMAQKIASAPDILGGEAPPNQPATTTLAMIEQGLSTFKSITARLLRNLGEELKAAYHLNARYVQEDAQHYAQVVDAANGQADMATDFNFADCDVVPVADASVVTDAQRMAKAQLILQTMQTPLAGYHNPMEALSRLYQAANIPIQGLVQAPQPDPAQEQAKQLNLQKLQADITKVLAQAKQAVAEGDAATQKAEVERIMTELEALQMLIEAAQPGGNGGGQAGSRGMAGAGDHAKAALDLAFIRGLPAGPMGGAGIPSGVPAVPPAGPTGPPAGPGGFGPGPQQPGF